ncbi:MAG: EpsI family protein [Candidatus Aureabacteria bacterium]|nr:EpsI family protein [Candidatus Auribacterota bacterium]
MENRKIAILICITVVAALAGSFAAKVSVEPLADVIPGIVPGRVGVWKSSDIKINDIEKELLPPDTEMVKKLYAGPDGKEIFVNIVISGKDRRSIHRAEVCLPSQGWVITGKETVSLPYEDSDGKKKTVDIQKLSVISSKKNVEITSLVLYYYIGGKRVTGNNLKRIFFTVYDRLFKGRQTRWSYVVIYMPLYGSESDTLGILENFFEQFMSDMSKNRGGI